MLGPPFNAVYYSLLHSKNMVRRMLVAVMTCTGVVSCGVCQKSRLEAVRNDGLGKSSWATA